MTTRDIERFFRALSRRFPHPARILMFGGGASIVLARPRATRDLDLELQLPDGTTAARAEELVEAIAAARADAQIPSVQAGEHIERWSMINWGDYRRHQRTWKRFGSITVELLTPEYFALTKLSRSSDVDRADIRAVFRRHHGSWGTLARICGRALRSSPASTSQFNFRLQVEHFFRSEGRAIWGKGFDPGPAIALFQKSYAKAARRSASGSP